MEAAANLLFEPEEVVYLLHDLSRPAVGMPSARHASDRSCTRSRVMTNVDVPFECRECGFTCGTDNAWQRHLDRRRSYGSCQEAGLATRTNLARYR